ncbi:MAG TPA: lysophospholipid acyltransferase family protein [Methylomirabilota bacterium]|nr:lysophospholipid acyltransferase family protein [Methylomirabilota bacterium]
MRTPVVDAFRPLVRGVSRVYFGLEFRGTEHVPAAGPLVITPNHQTFADPVLVTIPIRRRIYYMAWRRLFQVPVLSGLIRLLRAFPVDLDARDLGAVREARRLLMDEQAVVMIFPEGGRSVDGTLGRFHPGAFRLAASLGVPVLPVTIAGAHEAWPPGRTLPRPGRIVITYHPALTPEAAGDTRTAARELAERARAAIASALPR